MLAQTHDLDTLVSLLTKPVVCQEGDSWTDCHAALTRARRCLAELEARRVTVGIFGGTGVGKSTLLNAIAGTTLSRSGDRRPTTDRVVCYRHRDFPVPEWLTSADQSESSAPHEVDRLRGVILLDLPDTDSYKDEHRSRVHRILPHLDLLMVVTSVDKYGDQVLYDELNSFPQAPRNITFLLNAVDRLADESEVETVVEDFQAKLREHAGVDDPAVIPLSALRAIQGQGSKSGLDPVQGLLEALAGDQARRTVLTANAEVALEEGRERLDRLFPAQEIAPWLTELDAVSANVGIRGIEANLAEEIESTLTPWLRDRGLRASWFPIGWFYFLWRLRPWGRRQSRSLDLKTSTEPFAERALILPTKLARQRLLDLAASQNRKLRMVVPPQLEHAPQADHAIHGQWVETLAKKAPRLGWKIRQHLLPLFALVCTILWVARPALGLGDEEGSWTDVPGRMLDLMSRFSPIQWVFLGAGLLVYYLLAHSYFLYRIERTAHHEAGRAARLFTEAWTLRFRSEWEGPVSEQVRQLRVWWSDLESGRARLR